MLMTVMNVINSGLYEMQLLMDETGKYHIENTRILKR
jgi:hypothetical protein